MTSKEYLKQAYLLDAQINSQIRSLESYKSMRGVVQGMSYGERIGTNPNRNLEAPFVKTIEKIMLLEERINQEIDRLVDLKVEIGEAIDKMEIPAERLLLKYRYLDGMEWIDISQILAVSYRTVHRIHASALKNFEVPEKMEE